MTTGAELLGQMLPPLTAACERRKTAPPRRRTPPARRGANAERHAAAEFPAAETLRRLAQAVAVHRAGPPADDVTMVLAERPAVAARRNVP
jgi:hypothetical protein